MSVIHFLRFLARQPAFVAVVLLASPPFAAQAAPSSQLPAPVAASLKAAGIPASAVGVLVQEAGAREPRLAVNARQAMNPASVMKLVTTWTALETLGPAYTWTTTAAALEAPENGVIKGDLYLKGSGDPKLTLERFWLLLHQLRDRGVKEIRGDLVLDRSAFAPSGESGNFDDQPMRPYNVAPDALLLNFKAVRITLTPDEANKRITIAPEPKPENLDIVSLIKLGTGACGDFKDGLRSDLNRHDNRFRLILTGNYPLSCGERIWNLGVLPHDEYVGGVFRQLWRELGGEFSGQVKNGPTPAEARLVVTSESPALAEQIRDINKFSNNVMARQLFLNLATNRPATTDDAGRSIQRFLAERGLDMPELVLENGSGLSRRERITPTNLARLLQKAWESPLMPEFISSLPLTAVDGTMKKRLNGRAAAGQSHIKTGTLEGVKTIAGYVQNADGKMMIVVFLVNHPNAYLAQAAQDALLQWAYEGER